MAIIRIRKEHVARRRMQRRETEEKCAKNLEASHPVSGDIPTDRFMIQNHPCRRT